MATQMKTKTEEVYLHEGPVGVDKILPRKLLHLVVVLLGIGVLVLILGLVFISKSGPKILCKDESSLNRVAGDKSDNNNNNNNTSVNNTIDKKLTTLKEFCAYSDDAKQLGLEDFLKKVQKAYFDNNPNQVAYQPDLTMEELNENVKTR